MPTDTFYKLSEEKKEKIVEAGKYEFSKVPLSEASIKSIAKNAGIARGSFYQYFTSKEDLLLYILKENRETMEKRLDEQIKQANGDIFKIYINFYDDMTGKCFEDNNHQIYKKIFENIKTNDETIYQIMEKKRSEKIDEIRKKIDKSNLNIKEESDLDLIVQMLNAITMSSIVMSLKYDSKDEAREKFLRKLDLVKVGIIKNKDERKIL